MLLRIWIIMINSPGGLTPLRKRSWALRSIPQLVGTRFGRRGFGTDLCSCRDVSFLNEGRCWPQGKVRQPLFFLTFVAKKVRSPAARSEISLAFVGFSGGGGAHQGSNLGPAD